MVGFWKTEAGNCEKNGICMLLKSNEELCNTALFFAIAKGVDSWHKNTQLKDTLKYVTLVKKYFIFRCIQDNTSVIF